MGGELSAQEEKITLDGLKVEGDGDAWKTSSLSSDLKAGLIFGNEDPAKAYIGMNDYEYLYMDLNYTAESSEAPKCNIWVLFYNPMTEEKYYFYLYPVGEASRAKYIDSYNITEGGSYCVKIPDGARLVGAKCTDVEGTFTVNSIYLTKRETPAVDAVPYTLSFSSDLKAEVPIDPRYIQMMGNVTLNYTTGEVNCTGYGKMYIYLNNEDLRGCTSYTVAIEETNLEPVLYIKDEEYGEVGGIYNSRFNWNIQGDTDRKSKIGAIKYFCYEFSGSKTGTMTMASPTFTSGTAEAMQAGYTSLQDVPYVLIDGGTSVTPEWNLTDVGDGGLIYGHVDGTISRYADITDYEELRIYTDVTKSARLFICEADNGNVTQIYSNTPTYATSHVEEGYISFDIASLPKNSDSGKVRLQSIKWVWGSSGTVEKIVLYRTPAATDPDYVITGLGILQESVTDALADANARLIDATGLTGMSYNLTSANPNCIFKANSGVLTNANNVMVDGKIDKLSLTDGYDFAVPAEAKATAATYTRSTEANRFGTVCLPYDVTIPEDGSVKFYGIKEINAAKALVLEEKSGTLLAGTPAIVYSGNEVTSITLANNTEGSLGDSQQGSVDKLTLVGSYEAKSIDIDAESDASMYYYGISDNQFVRAKKTLNVKPFRAYITAEQTTGAEANVLRLLIGDDDVVTGNLQQAKAAPTVEAIYNTQGVRLSTMQKGLNIVQMSNGQSVKVLVK